MKLLLTLGVIILFQSSIFAQELTVYVGIAQASMSDLKKLQTLLAQNAPVQLEITQSFPAYWQYGMKMNWIIANKVNLGFRAFTTSTGARSSYKDYSGQIVDDHTLRCYSVAPNLEYLFIKKNKFELSGYAAVGLLFTIFNWHSYYAVGSNFQIEDDNYKSTNSIVETGVQVRQHYKKIFFEASAGIQVNVPGDLKNKKDGSKIYIGHNATADWSGARISLGIGYNFYK
jgi:hypothetical protein